MNFWSRKDMTKFQRLYEASKLGTFFSLVISRNSKKLPNGSLYFCYQTYKANGHSILKLLPTLDMKLLFKPFTCDLILWCIHQLNEWTQIIWTKALGQIALFAFLLTQKNNRAQMKLDIWFRRIPRSIYNVGRLTTIFSQFQHWDSTQPSFKVLVLSWNYAN